MRELVQTSASALEHREFFGPPKDKQYQAAAARYRLWALSHEKNPASIDTVGDFFAHVIDADLFAPATMRFYFYAIRAAVIDNCPRAAVPMIEAAFKPLLRRIPRIAAGAPEVITREQYEKMIAGSSPEKAAVLELLWRTGARASEICGIKTAKCHESGNITRIELLGKGAKIRDAWIPTELFARIRRLHRSEKYLLPSGNSRSATGHMSRFTLWRLVRAAAEHAEIKAWPHLFRHSFATRLLASGYPIHEVSVILGHASIATTQIYAHPEIDPERLTRCAE